MTTKNFQRTLQAFQRRVPFRPFIVELVSGTRFQVEHAESLVFRNGEAVHIAASGITLFDHEGVTQLTSDSQQQKSA